MSVSFMVAPCISGFIASLDLSPDTSIVYERVKKQGNRTIDDPQEIRTTAGQQDDRKQDDRKGRPYYTTLTALSGISSHFVERR